MEKEPELVLKLRNAEYETKGRAILKRQMHQKLADVMRNHGDEVILGGSDDYLLAVRMNSNGVDYVLNCHTYEHGYDLPFTTISFESASLNKTLVLSSAREEALAANSTFDSLAKISKQKGKKQKEGFNRINYRQADKADLCQFAELVDLLEERVRYRRGGVDPIGFQSRLGVA